MVPVDHAEFRPSTMVAAVKALRAPFLAASVLPFCAGFALAPGAAQYNLFWLGLLAVACTHLSANLINDYADTRSGVDTRDPVRYGLFGGSKLIHTGELSVAFFFNGATLFAVIAAGAVAALSMTTGRADILVYLAGILALAWMYSCAPLKLSYRHCGEPVVFLLFGPAVVMGGYSLRTGAFPAPESALLAIPFGLLTTLLLVANEIPDHPEDSLGGKRNWIDWTGPSRAWLLYAVLALLVMVSVTACVVAGVLGPRLYLALAAAIPALWHATRLLRRHFDSKHHCLQASKLTLGAQLLIALVIILDIALWQPNPQF
ncbi:MAG: prenyltransferase [Verrucomicrobiota bacterium]